MLRFLNFFLYTTTFSSAFIYGVEFPQCDNAAMGSFIAVANNCSKAVYCNGVESDILNCGEDSPYFSSEDQKCHNSYSVCGNRPFKIPLSTSTTETMSSNFPANPNPTTTDATTIASATELFTRNTTSNEQTFPTTLTQTEAGTSLSESSASTVFTTASTKITSAIEMEPVFVQCPAVDNPSKPLFLPHPKSCSKYYLCYHGVATLMTCPNKLHFDVTQHTCNTPERAKCQVDLLIPRLKCQMHTVDFYPHPTNCNYYYLCEYGFLMVMQCPFNMYYDYIYRICAMGSMAKCYNVNSIYSY